MSEASPLVAPMNGAQTSNWIPDAEAPCCMRCAKTFTFFVRKHHCRTCGHVICNDCSGSTRGEERMCRNCRDPDMRATPAAAAHAAKVKRHLFELLPPPSAVQHWLYGGTLSGDSHSNRHGDSLVREATEWLVNAVQHAYLSPMIKKAGRNLMACFSFTANLSNTSGCWNEILMPKLKAALVMHGEDAKRANAACNLATTLTQDAVLAIASFNADIMSPAPRGPAYPDGADCIVPVTAQPSSTTPPTAPPLHRRVDNFAYIPPRESVRQDLLMPSLAAAVSTDYERDWKQQPEHVYIHAMLLIGSALDLRFGDALAEVASDLTGVKVHEAPLKSYIRMQNKLRSKDDHQLVKMRPRPAMNIDIVRRLASADTPEDVLELVQLAAARFGGLSHLKCLPELANIDPAAADARFHMLPIMMTVIFGPEGLTVGDLLADKEVRALWTTMRSAQPSTDALSLEQWQLDHDAAIEAIEVRCDPTEPVRMHCELQVVTTATAAVRHKMHEIYKVYRADNGLQLYADFATPDAARMIAAVVTVRDGDDGALISAARDGRIATVKRLLAGVGSGNEVDAKEGGGGDSSSGAGGAGSSVEGGSTAVNTIDVNQRSVQKGRTALFWAAACGHLSVVVALLEVGNADPNQQDTADGATPLHISVQAGHVEVVAKLLEHGTADPNQAAATNGMTPLYMAAVHGHVEIAAKLLEHGTTDPNQATVVYGVTPLHMAAEKGHVEVVAKLLEHGATDPNQARTTDGATPLWIAAQQGHVEVVAKLLEHTATDPKKGRRVFGFNQTPLYMAKENGHSDIVAMLRAAAADR